MEENNGVWVRVTMNYEETLLLLLRHKNEESYSFVNLTDRHICPRKYNCIQDAIADLDKLKESGRIDDYKIIS